MEKLLSIPGTKTSDLVDQVVMYLLRKHDDDFFAALDDPELIPKRMGSKRKVVDYLADMDDKRLVPKKNQNETEQSEKVTKKKKKKKKRSLPTKATKRNNSDDLFEAVTEW